MGRILRLLCMMPKNLIQAVAVGVTVRNPLDYLKFPKTNGALRSSPLTAFMTA